MADYFRGNTDPHITPDAGAGAWDSEDTTLKMRALKELMQDYMAVAASAIGQHAADHLSHYLGNSGKDYYIDLESLVADVPSGTKLFETEMTAAMQFVETLPEGNYEIASRKASGGYAKKSESSDWFYATGGYSAWGKGLANVHKFANGTRYNTLLFDYRYYDRYNWDKGKSVHIGPVEITDAFMGRFHREGLAQEFDMYGTARRWVTWWTGKAPTIMTMPVH
jgi:hypothetical protein